jgi:23S rRNA (adenine2030-N6)-methyltransferase
MNYRHAYHAGNFADCMKHALLVWLLRALRRKPGAVFVLDTHAGTGRTDLECEEAAATLEWRQGIGRLLTGEAPEALADYLALVRACGERIYPGSPLLIRMMLREQDRLACCELHAQDCAALRRMFQRDPHVAVHVRDGWEALGALLPPREARRGLVLIDPPFELPQEFERLVDGIRLARRRFAGGVVAAWYPIKHRAPVREFHDRLRDSGEPDLVCAELILRPPLDPARLNGCGLLVAAPPWGFEEEAAAILDAIADRLAGPEGESEARGEVTRLTRQRSGA